MSVRLSVNVLRACRTVWRQVLPSLVSLLSTGDSERQVQRAVCALLRVASYGAQNVENKVRHTTVTTHDDARTYCAQKLTARRLSLPHGINTKNKCEKIKSNQKTVEKQKYSP